MSIQAAEFVGRGHPDKIADIIADSLVERVLKWDPQGRCAFEVLASYGLIVVAGEVGGNFRISDLGINEVIEEILYACDYVPQKFQFITNIKEQSPDIISTSIENKEGLVAGDQSVCIGYACTDTFNFLPLAYELARWTVEKISNVEGAKDDSKVMVVTNEGEVKKIIISLQHDERIDLEKFKEEIMEKACDCNDMLCIDLFKKQDCFLINTSGKFLIGGLYADTGVTNRKIVSDCYGTAAHHGGGGLCGKDLTKVDRLGTYWARWICKNMVASGLCKSLELELIFSYGAKKPIFNIKNYDSKYPKSKLLYAIDLLFPFTFQEIYEKFNKPGIEYSRLTESGQFGGVDCDLPWESLEMVEAIRAWEIGLLEDL